MVFLTHGLKNHRQYDLFILRRWSIGNMNCYCSLQIFWNTDNMFFLDDLMSHTHDSCIPKWSFHPQKWLIPVLRRWPFLFIHVLRRWFLNTDNTPINTFSYTNRLLEVTTENIFNYILFIPILRWQFFGPQTIHLP